MAKRRVTRKQLLKEPDEFISFSNRMIKLGVMYKKQLAMAAGIFFVAVLVFAGVQYISSRSQEKALNLLDNAVTRYGQVLATQGHLKALEAVEKDFQLILDKYGSNAGGKLARVTYAQCNFAADRPDEAIRLYEKALGDFAAEPFYHAVILSGIGYAYAHKGDTGRAISYFEQVVSGPKVGPRGDAMFNLALLYEQAGQTDRSSALFKQVVDEYPDAFYTEMAGGKAAL